MATEKILIFDEAGNAKRMKVRIARFLDNEPVTASDKTNIRTTLDVDDSLSGTFTTPLSVTSASDSSFTGGGNLNVTGGISVETLEVTDKIDLSGAPTQQLEVYGDAPTLRVTDTSFLVGDGDSIGKLEFYGNDGSAGGPNVRARIDTVSENSYGNTYGLAISTSSANAAPVERVRVDGLGNVTLHNGNLVLSSGAIDFGSTNTTTGVTVTGSTLDHYEEGTWTVTNDGDATGVINASEATYTRIGNIVTVRATFIVTTNFTSNKIGGLPYLPATNSISNSTSGTPVMTLSATSSPIIAHVLGNTDTVRFTSGTNLGTTHALNTTHASYRVFLSYNV